MWSSAVCWSTTVSFTAQTWANPRTMMQSCGTLSGFASARKLASAISKLACDCSRRKVCPNKPEPTATLGAPSRKAAPQLRAPPAAARGKPLIYVVDKPTHLTPKAKAGCGPALTTFLALCPAALSAVSLAALPFIAASLLPVAVAPLRRQTPRNFHPKVLDAALVVDPKAFEVCLGSLAKSVVARDCRCPALSASPTPPQHSGVILRLEAPSCSARSTAPWKSRATSSFGDSNCW